jgi:hypothetical protein
VSVPGAERDPGVDRADGLGQSVTTGTVSGIVLPGSASPGRRSLEAGLVSGQRTMASDASGKFMFLSAPPGTYTVTTSPASFNTDSVSVAQRRLSVALTVNLTIAASTGDHRHLRGADRGHLLLDDLDTFSAELTTSATRETPL